MVRTDLSRLKSVSGAEDKRKVEAHLEGISSLENRLSSLAPNPSGSVAGPAAPAGSTTAGCAKPTLRAVSDTVNAIHTQMDLITSAFACDLTRTATLQLGNADGFRDLPGFPNQHNTTHGKSAGASASVIADHKKWDRFYAERWAYLFGKLDSIKEGNGTLLDNTLIVFGSDTTTAQSFEYPGAHSFHRFPMWLAGGGNFAFKTGQHIKLPLGPSPRSLLLTTKWTAHQRLLTSVAQAFGMNVDKFGASDIGSGPLPAAHPGRIGSAENHHGACDGVAAINRTKEILRGVNGAAKLTSKEEASRHSDMLSKNLPYAALMAAAKAGGSKTRNASTGLAVLSGGVTLTRHLCVINGQLTEAGHRIRVVRVVHALS